jgi:hypothetical protein
LPLEPCGSPDPSNKVWAALRDFHDLGWAEGVINSLEKVGDVAADQVGAKRLLNGVFHETLQSLDDDGHKLTYSIDDGPEALSKDNVTGYMGCVRAFPVTDAGHTFVLWTSKWESGGEGTKDFCDPVYVALLAALGKHFSA